MKTVKVSDLFEVKYGVNLELVNLEECEKSERDSINFVSRIEKNNGISAYVKKVIDIKPNPTNTISVAGGGSVLSTFFQGEEYYSGRDIYILIPKKDYSETEMIFFAYTIRQNKYRYNYGRQANKTLKDIMIPEVIPVEWEIFDIKQLNTLNRTSLIFGNIKLNLSRWKNFRLADVFEISLGQPVHSDQIEDYLGNDLTYVTRTTENNGVEFLVRNDCGFEPNQGGCLTVGAEGFKAFYQPRNFLTGNKVNVFKNKSLSVFNALFIKSILDLEIGKKFNYGRGATKDRLSNLEIKLPSKNNEPDWLFMENYIKSLPYSSNL